MNWEQLLSLKRQGDTSKRLRKEQDDTRLGFEVDYDRIIFSAAFRSLQDKTQVIPLSKTDFVHTRLTHSLEVSVVGRSIGRLVGKKIIEKYPHLQEIHGYQANDFGAIVAAACLAHDIGNPPFGHSGEKAIGEYFSIGKGQQFKDKLTNKQWQDLIDFEGNANGFSVLTASRPGVTGGLRLTYAVLGAFMKYPKESLPKKPTSNIADKKYGFFQTDKDFFQEVATELGMIPNKTGNDMGYERHPLAYLVEAADDICYTIIDFEDGMNLGLVSEDFALEYLIKLVKDSIDSNKYNTLTTKEDRISYLRALAIGSLINDAVKIFIESEELILAGNFPYSLMDKSKYKAQMNDIIKLSVKNIYQSREVIEKELIGYQIINNLLDKFITAYNNNYQEKATNFDALLLKILPEKYHLEKDSLYERLLHICHFISILTDGNALLYNKIVASNNY
ncbi:deoxyguanosinetriphosphate triphosphohydrolase [Flavobacterium psychrophilum]|uniref:Deoxyguanosinetriphosphate triphosphohydrolase (dGTPase) n=2 Tax=Flavobacterium psychrophilum TaxID=96345 RepID=A6GWC3_FLAPJ|nr:deoxyguanosinetriphosphate triphosphohydrolase [Flavobacterium psychrophilum]AIG29205.1 dGTPase [Flavobacterium psychrophilum]AIG31481.1 dGTPase [Flavobacterium psychrophilum]AIG33638.1 dGTPase [Flavobacterium psychrophilum]AIG35997.1 dGTPase [Flavobacterium psychrophilum]AIG38261.1 dGTPase [Flavobacterium psychrophilum]